MINLRVYGAQAVRASLGVGLVAASVWVQVGCALPRASLPSATAQDATATASLWVTTGDKTRLLSLEPPLQVTRAGKGPAAEAAASIPLAIAEASADGRLQRGQLVVLEAMGRNAGWLAAGSALWRRDDADGPHVLLVPERPFDEALFLSRIEATVARVGYAVVMATETIKDRSGEYVARRSDGVDQFGHPLVAGTADALAALVTARLSLKSRVVKPGTAQRTSVAHVSPVDREGARVASLGGNTTAVNFDR